MSPAEKVANAASEPKPRDRLIVALDVPTVDDARALVTTLGDAVSFYKVGLELVMRGGLDFARGLTATGKRVFLDMKLLDIGNTVERAVANAAETGADFLTVHCTDTKTLKAAVAGCAGTNLKILAVTVLTNLDADDLAEQGIMATPEQLVERRARLAAAAGCHGVIASGREAAAVRAAAPPDFLIVTPGIRMPDGDAGDQQRVTTPASAIGDGADYLVVGRPITQASDPAASARAFVDEIASSV
jgi:orotidine-5'-phosphate decarboxylase